MPFGDSAKCLPGTKPTMTINEAALFDYIRAVEARIMKFEARMAGSTFKNHPIDRRPHAKRCDRFHPHPFPRGLLLA